MPAGSPQMRPQFQQQAHAGAVAAVDDDGITRRGHAGVRLQRYATALPRTGHVLTPAMTGSPAVRQSDSPPSSGRAENPLARKSRTASGANTQ